MGVEAMRKQSSYILCIFLFVLLCSPPVIPLELANVYSIEDAVEDDQFDQKMSLYMKLARFPALSACVIQDDEVVWSKGYGYYDLSDQKVPDKDTIYCIASITKTVVGTALMQLWEKERFDLDDDVNQYLPFSLRNPHFPDDPITFRMLLSHTSSLSTNTRNEYYWMNFSGDPPFSFFPEPFLEEFLVPGGRFYHEQVWSDTARPGEQAMYANVGFDLISFLVEILSGEPFLDYCQMHIFDPLDMDDTSFNLSTLPLDRVALPYQSFLGSYYQIDEVEFLFGPLTPPQPYWKMRSFPAGGLYTSIDDLAHFLIAHMNKGVFKDIRILENETVELMQQIDPDNAIGYGLAWMRYPLSPTTWGTGHGGDIMGVDTWMLYDDIEDIGVIYFANGNPAWSYCSVIGSLAIQKILQSLYEKEIDADQQVPSNLVSFNTIEWRKNLFTIS